MNIIEPANDITKIDNKRLRMSLNCILINFTQSKVFVEKF